MADDIDALVHEAINALDGMPVERETATLALKAITALLAGRERRPEAGRVKALEAIQGAARAPKGRAAAEAEVIALARQLSGEVDYPVGGNVALGGDAWRTLTRLCIAARRLRFV